MSVATIVCSNPNSSVEFLIARTQTGWPIDQREIDEEELRSKGVDGRRWRDESYQQMPFDMETVQDYSAYVTGVIYARTYKFLKGKIVKLSVTIDARPYNFNYVHVLGVTPRVVKGQAFGTGALGASGGCIVYATWSLVNMGNDVVATA